MSNLLQSVLSSRLANATLGTGTGTSTSTSTSTGNNGNDGTPHQADSPPHTEALNEWEQVDSEDELVHVRSQPATAAGTPLERSRASSPTPFQQQQQQQQQQQNRQQSSRLAVETDTTDQDSDDVGSDGGRLPSSTSQQRLSKTGESRLRPTASRGSSKRTSKTTTSKTDPLRSLNSEIAQHIFLQLPVEGLIACSGVCKRWRRSATLNYCWYRQYQREYSSAPLSSTVDPTSSVLAIPAWGSGGAKWTRRESKTDWKTQFGKHKRQEARDAARLESLPGSGTTTPSRTQRLADAGIQTTHQARMEQWQQEADSTYTKQEMRDYYKSGSKGGKFKGKREKGGVKTNAAGDGGLWQ
ncbi:hypothetical protein BCV70DRAFT_201114 [Testicularia cyperi]|uniref:F-box domain-containing protein n=1 Tax=Testicularia cyperi TaxID=1882483 RepID=A0A317XML1_9BASI|nr:hypothetical protein BCV70DRAFT_201114 [Testicularia cyperi]